VDTIYPLDDERPTRAEIRLGALRRNFARAKALAGAGVKVMAVVKANAYGHGLERVAREFLAAGADSLGVAFLEEGDFLRRAGVDAPILVLGPAATPQIPRFIELDLEATVPSIEKARAFSDAALAMGRKARVHLKFDTGMERIGVHWYSAAPFVDAALGMEGLELAGAFTHFATADDDLDFAKVQLDRFHEVIRLLESRGARPPLLHAANSAALVALPEARLDLVRPGLMLYGYEPVPGKPVGLEPVMRLMSRVSYFKVARAGAALGYGSTYRLERDSRVATVPAGYGDGYSRLLSNRGRAIVRGRSYPVAGRVCMDQFMLDLGPDGEAYNGDEVLLFGEKNGDRVPLEELCALMGTIPYEATCMIASRVPRIYVED